MRCERGACPGDKANTTQQRQRFEIIVAQKKKKKPPPPNGTSMRRRSSCRLSSARTAAASAFFCALVFRTAATRRGRLPICISVSSCWSCGMLARRRPSSVRHLWAMLLLLVVGRRAVKDGKKGGGGVGVESRVVPNGLIVAFACASTHCDHR